MVSQGSATPVQSKEKYEMVLWLLTQATTLPQSARTHTMLLFLLCFPWSWQQLEEALNAFIRGLPFALSVASREPQLNGVGLGSGSPDIFIGWLKWGLAEVHRRVQEHAPKIRRDCEADRALAFSLARSLAHLYKAYKAEEPKKPEDDW